MNLAYRIIKYIATCVKTTAFVQHLNFVQLFFNLMANYVVPSVLFGKIYIFM